MVKNDDIKSIVMMIVFEIKGEIKNEIIKEVKEVFIEEFMFIVMVKVRNEFDSKIDIKVKEFEFCIKDILEGMNMDLDVLKEKFYEYLKEL